MFRNSPGKLFRRFKRSICSHAAPKLTIPRPERKFVYFSVFFSFFYTSSFFLLLFFPLILNFYYPHKFPNLHFIRFLSFLSFSFFLHFSPLKLVTIHNAPKTSYYYPTAYKSNSPRVGRILSKRA